MLSDRHTLPPVEPLGFPELPASLPGSAPDRTARQGPRSAAGAQTRFVETMFPRQYPPGQGPGQWCHTAGPSNHGRPVPPLFRPSPRTEPRGRGARDHGAHEPLAYVRPRFPPLGAEMNEIVAEQARLAEALEQARWAVGGARVVLCEMASGPGCSSAPSTPPGQVAPGQTATRLEWTALQRLGDAVALCERALDEAVRVHSLTAGRARRLSSLLD